MDCNLGSGTTFLYWFNGSAWLPATIQQPDTPVSGCITETVTGATAPNLTQLTFTPFVGGATPTLARLAGVHLARHGAELTLRWRVTTNRDIAGFDVYAGVHRLNRRLIAVHRSPFYQYRTRYAGHSKLPLHVLLTSGEQVVVPAT